MAADEHTISHDLMPIFALGCLGPEEMSLVARHLPDCTSCREEFESFQAVVDALALVAPDAAPSAELRQRLMAGASAAGASRRPRTEASPSNGPSPRRRGPARLLEGRRAWPVLAILALAAVVLGGLIWAAVGRSASGDRANALPPVIFSPTDLAPGASGELRFAGDGRAATLEVKGLPPLPDAQSYQLWLVRDEQRDSGAVFSVNANGWAEVPVDLLHPAPEYFRFGITIEPAGGSPGPTGEPVLGSG